MRILKKIIPALLTVILLAAMLTLLSILTMPKLNTQEAGHTTWAAYGFEAEAKDSIDLFLLGDSESRTSISPMELFHDYGISSYCCGINANNLSEVDDMLRLVMKYQSPRVVILECNVIFTPFDWKEALETTAEAVFPVIYWHNRWKTLLPGDFTRFPKYDSIEVRKGYYHSRGSNAAPPYMLDRYMVPDESVYPVGKINKWYLKRIKGRCEKKGAQLILMSMPSVKNWSAAKHNACAELAQEMDVPFVDLNEMRDEVPIDWNVDTRDRGDHLNNIGMQKVCAWLGPWLRENYGLEDHRGDPSYDASWTDQYDAYLEWVYEENK